MLASIESGDHSAAERLLPLVYEELRRLTAAMLAPEKPRHSLQAIALAHEASSRLVDQTLPQQWDDYRLRQSATATCRDQSGCRGVRGVVVESFFTARRRSAQKPSRITMRSE